MKKLIPFIILLAVALLLQSAAEAQNNRNASWTGSVVATQWTKITLNNTNASNFNIDAYNPTGGSGNLLVAENTADTAAAVSGNANYVIIPVGGVQTLFLSANSIWLKSTSGTLTSVIINKYDTK